MDLRARFMAMHPMGLLSQQPPSVLGELPAWWGAHREVLRERNLSQPPCDMWFVCEYSHTNGEKIVEPIWHTTIQGMYHHALNFKASCEPHSVRSIIISDGNGRLVAEVRKDGSNRVVFAHSNDGPFVSLRDEEV